MMRLIAPALVAGLLMTGGMFPARAGPPEKPPYPERGLKGAVSADRLPMPDNPVLLRGRAVWDGTCRVCHGVGLAGAPKITSGRQWKKRIAKGLPTLFAHAKNGFENPVGGTMPARGGKPDLSDPDIEAAVRYMIANSGGADVARQGL